MPRRRVVTTSSRVPRGPEYDEFLVKRFINIVMKDGKKNLAERIFNRTLDLISEKVDQPPVEIFKQAIENIKPSVEVKSRRVGGSTYQVPVEVRPERRLALSIRWLVDSSRSRTERGYPNRLAGVLIDAANNTGTAWKKKEDTHKMADANKAFSHYKW